MEEHVKSFPAVRSAEIRRKMANFTLLSRAFYIDVCLHLSGMFGIVRKVKV